MLKFAPPPPSDPVGTIFGRMPDLWRNRTRGAKRWINHSGNIRGNRPVSWAASTSAAAPCSASDTAVCTAGSPISNAADKAVNAGKVVSTQMFDLRKLTDNAKYRPFCSKRCADIDLGTWFAEGYVIEGKAPVDEEEGE